MLRYCFHKEAPERGSRIAGIVEEVFQWGGVAFLDAVISRQIQLDIRTSVVIAMFVSLVTSLIGALVWKKRRHYPGFGRWTLGNLLGTLCLIFLILRGIAPDWISIVLANAMALAAAILFLQGIRLFRGLKLYWWPEHLAGVLALAAVIYYRYSTNNLSARAIAMSVTLGTFGICCSLTLLRQSPAKRTVSMVLTSIVFTLGGAVNFFRAYLYASQPMSDLFAPSGQNAAFFAAVGLGVVGWSFGFLLMTDEPLTLDLVVVKARTALNEVADAPQAPALRKAVPEAEVRQQLQRIVESEGFRRSARMERFLMVAAERTLMGHPEELKEYSIGRDVFNRGENYDPRTDSIVRVEAQRLRRKLREYYESLGTNDCVVVEFLPGSYVPHFRYKELHSNHGNPNR